jgi:hypothetical protein
VLRLKRILLPCLLVLGVLLSALYVVSSYIFIDPSLLIMLGQSKPAIFGLVSGLRNLISLGVTNQVSLGVVVLLNLIAVVMVFSKKEIGNRVLWLAILIPTLLVFAYPIVSRDIFSYLYYAKMVLVYHQNPFLVTPNTNFEVDMWLGFVHNIERVYVYGPVALIINLIPMALVGAEKFIVNVFVLKTINLAFFLFGAWIFWKITKNRNYVLVLWIINPYIINELLINGHNDLMMIVLFWLAIYAKQKSKTVAALLAYALSAGTKYVTAILIPILFLPKKMQSILAWCSIVVIGGYFIYHSYLPWYYSWIYFLIPYLKLNKGQIFSILFLQLSLTLTYAGFLQYGLWGTYSSIHILTTILKLTNWFVPLFVLATIIPYLWNKFKPLRFC